MAEKIGMTPSSYSLIKLPNSISLIVCKIILFVLTTFWSELLLKFSVFTVVHVHVRLLFFFFFSLSLFKIHLPDLHLPPSHNSATVIVKQGADRQNA